MGILADGYRTTVAFPGLPTQIFTTLGLEREVQPPDIEVGEIDITTMRNGTTFNGGFAANSELLAGCRTKVPKKLVSYGDATVQFAYDPTVYSFVALNMGRIGLINITTPSGAIIAFYGWIDKITPPSHKEGEFPIAEMKIKVSCRNAYNNGTEVAPIAA